MDCGCAPTRYREVVLTASKSDAGSERFEIYETLVLGSDLRGYNLYLSSSDGCSSGVSSQHQSHH
jgi:hypothetical protein